MLAVVEAEADLHRGRDLLRLPAVPERVARHVLEVPVVVAVGGHVDQLGRGHRVVPGAAVRVVDALDRRHRVARRGTRAADVECALAGVVDVAVEAQQQFLGAGPVVVHLEVGVGGRVGDEVRQEVGRVRRTGCRAQDSKHGNSQSDQADPAHWSNLRSTRQERELAAEQQLDRVHLNRVQPARSSEPAD